MIKIIRLKTLISTLVLITFFGTYTACSMLPQEEEALAPPLVQPKRTEYELYKVSRKDISKKFYATGSIISAEEASLYFEESNSRLKSIEVTLGQKIKKGHILATKVTADLEDQVRLQQKNVEKMQVHFDSQNKLLEKYLSMPADYRPTPKEIDELTASLKLLGIDLDIARIQLEGLNRKMAKSVLVAPFDGEVTFIEDYKSGDAVEAYKNIVTIANPARLQLYYQSPDLSNEITVGMKAEITYKGAKFPGEVVLSPEYAPKDALEKYKDALVVKSEFFTKDAVLGNSADFAIILASKKNVIVIPKKGIKTASKRNYVQVLEGNRKKEYDVQKGIETSDEVEIISGLNEGQSVILN